MEHEAGAVRARGDYGMISANQRSKAELFQRPTMREENCMYVPPFELASQGRGYDPGRI